MGRNAWMQRWHGEGGARELLRLAWPLILGNSFWTIQIALDRVLLSRASSELVGAAMAAALLFWTPITFLQYTANYATTFVAQYTGAGQNHRVGPVVWQALYFSSLTGVAFLGLIPLAPWIVGLGGHAPELQKLEVAYFQCLCFSALPTLVTAATCSFFAGRGDSRTVLLVNAVSVFVNAPLAYAWIYGRWGFPAWGIEGAGWATVVATSASAMLAFGLMLRPQNRAEFATASGWRLEAHLLGRLLRYGLSNGFLVAMDTLVFTLFLILVGRLGEVELAASSITFTLNLFAFLPIMGIAQAVGILVGQRQGERRPDRAARSTWTGFWVAFLGMGIVSLPYLLVPNALAWVFRSEADLAHWEEVRVLIPVLLRFVALYALFDSTNLVFSFALRGAGDTLFVTLTSMLIAWSVMVIPTWAAWRYHWGLYWAWTFASLYIVVLSLAVLLRFVQGKWRSMRVIETSAVAVDLQVN
jgi:multidrug resistance protein, MATE family